ncbi:hypothetical protein ACJ72_04978 [Emergomyces africanus]|uniref:Uncharacterized protein n=1 Tax=Emergomyces africanus TaxID=1955775 RepID=A0A1B7NVA1_9EURO|nr:hypothetical protein ACJ72_04978 [Emergomyces africanus]
MPIPTRRLSLREPHIGLQRRPPPGLDLEDTIPEVERSRSIKPRSNTVSFTAPTSTTSALTSAANRKSNLPLSNQPISDFPQPASTATGTTSIGGNDSYSGGGDNTTAARRRSFLPQRSNWHKGGPGSVSSGKSQLQMQDSQLQQLRDANIQEAQAPMPQSLVLAQPAETSAVLPDLSQQPPPPLSPSKLSRQATSPTRSQAVGISRLERPGSSNKSKFDAPKSPHVPTTRLERAGSSSTTSSQLSRPQSLHIVSKLEKPGSSSTTTSQASRLQSKPTQRIEGSEGLGSGNTSKPEAPKPQTTNATRLERSASLRQPTASRVTATANHSRHQSQVVGSTKGHTGLKQVESNTSSTPSLKSIKPQFSTFQQHYSPKKGPKSKPPLPPASTSPTAATATGTGIELASQNHPHTAALQAELLQLHLLHTESLRAIREWESSAEQQLCKRHKSAVSNNHTLLAREQAVQRHVNNLALETLAADSKTHTHRSSNNNNNDNDDKHNNNSNRAYDFSEQIQVLSHVIQDVAALTDMRGGRYISCVYTFEKWFEHVVRVRQGRSDNRNGSRSRKPAAVCKHRDDYDDQNYYSHIDKRSCKYEFIDPLSSKWKEEVAALGVKLELCSRELDCLDVIDVRVATDGHEKGVDADTDGDGEFGNGYPSSSALARAVSGHKMLLASMVEELEVMSAVETDVGKLEKLWVRVAVDRLRSSSGGDAVGRKEERQQPAWVVG